MFSEAYLARELNSDPSVASGLSPFHTGKGMTWLIEPKRAKTVIHFSFTLEHRRVREDLRCLTIDAFVHFAFGFSNKQLVFADIQGRDTLSSSQTPILII